MYLCFIEFRANYMSKIYYNWTFLINSNYMRVIIFWMIPQALM